jgi:hypothetical protein
MSTRQHQTDAELRAYFDELKDTIQRATSSLPIESSLEKHRRIQRLQADPVAAAQYYYPHYLPKPMHKEAKRCLKLEVNAQWLYLLKAWPRGHAKSTYTNTIMPPLRKAAGRMKCMALIGATKDHAKVLLSDLQAEYEANERYINDFGKQMRWGEWAEGKFVTTDGAIHIAQGLKQPVRGLKKQDHRLDTALMDDCDDPKRARNEELTHETVLWVREDLLGCAGPDGLLYVNSNNIFSKNTIQNLLIQTGVFQVSKFNAMDEKGRIVWPEVYDRAFFERQLQIQGSIAYNRNYFHDITEVGKCFKEEHLPWREPLPLNQYDRLLWYHDVAFSDSGDCNAIGLIGRKGRRFDLLDCFVDQVSFINALRWLYRRHLYYADRAPAVSFTYWMEEQFFEGFTAADKKLVDAEFGFVLPILMDKRKKPKKADRIEAMFPLYAEGVVGFNAKEQSNPHFIRMRDQHKAFSPEGGGRAKDDGPDMMEGGIHKLNVKSFGDDTGSHRRMDRREQVFY